MSEKLAVFLWADAEQPLPAWGKTLPPATIILAGPQARAAAQDLQNAGHQILVIADFTPTYAALKNAAQAALAAASGATLILAQDEAPWAKVMPWIALQGKGAIDTHLDQLNLTADALCGQRGYFRQRLKATFTRTARPWVMTLAAAAQIKASAVQQAGAIQTLPAPAASTRTTWQGQEKIGGAVETLRPNAAMLVVAGAGLCKPQADGQSHVDEAEILILDLCQQLQASLGSTKSLVDQSGDGHATLKCLTHLHQVGQTGSTPHHQAGIAIGCHGEAPHVVGWRFIQNRLAINLDPHCGWATEADYLYVADAFKLLPLVLEKLKA